MSEQDTPQALSPEEDARIGTTPATFANKLYITMMAGGAKITFAEAQRVAGKDEVWPRVAVFLQRADLAALHRLLDAAVNAVASVTVAGHRRAAGTGRQRPNPDNALPRRRYTYGRPDVIRRHDRTGRRWRGTLTRRPRRRNMIGSEHEQGAA